MTDGSDGSLDKPQAPQKITMMANPANAHLEVEQCATGIGATGSDISVSFPAAALRLYTVEYTDDLTTTNWTGLVSTNTLSCTGELMTVTDSGAVNLPQRFYRLRIHPNLLGQ